MEYDLVVVNGVVVTASDIAEYDIAIQGEKIALLAPKGTPLRAKKTIDAKGGYVMVCTTLPYMCLITKLTTTAWWR